MSSSSLFRRGALALLYALSVAAYAQPPANPETKPDAPAATPADPATPPTPAPVPPAAEPEKPAEEKALRRVDEEPQPPKKKRNRNRRSISQDGAPFGDHYISAGNEVQEAVSIMGSTTVDGTVINDAVSVMGSTIVSSTGKVGGAVVAVLGHIETKGNVGREVVSVLGEGKIDGQVDKNVVCVMGDLELGPNAVIHGDLVTVGGTITRHPNAVVNGNEVRVPFMMGHHNFDWLMSYVRNCVFLARPLAFGPNLAWAWAIALGFLAFYLLLALLFPTALLKCNQTLETRPGGSILAAVLTVLLTPVAIVLLCCTVVGVVLVPFLLIGLMFATLFGKAALLAWIGRRFTKFFGDGVLGHLFFAVLLGGLIVLMLYVVPVVGFLTLKLLGWLGVGLVIYTILLGMKRPKAAMAAASASGTASAAAAAATMPMVTSMPVPASAVPVEPVAVAPEPAVPPVETSIPPVDPVPPAMGAVPMPPPVAPPPVAPQPVPIASTLPRAGFWIRIGALLLDVILIAVISAFISSMTPRVMHHFFPSPPGFLPVLAIYGAVMWKLRGTTIGGIVCGLKVVRVDNRPLDWATAFVRALGCFLSLIVVGLGFIWVVIDDEKQSWHDKIAGTTVVRVPKGVSLL